MIDEHERRVPGAELRPFVAWAVGYRQAGVGPQRHRGLPSPWLTFIVTLDDPLVIEAHVDPRQLRPLMDAGLVADFHCREGRIEVTRQPQQATAATIALARLGR